MSVYDELVRLGALYIDALADPYSCPRDRQILLAKITDLEEEASRLKIRAARAAEASEVEVERAKTTLQDLRSGFRPKPLPVDEGSVERYLEAWRQERGEEEHIRRWEAEHQF